MKEFKCPICGKVGYSAYEDTRCEECEEYKDNNKEYWEERDRDNYLDMLEVFSEVET